MKLAPVITLTALTLFIIGYGTPAYGATTTASSTYQNSAAVEKRVREYFADIPVMIEIARCESEFRQFNPDGTVLRGGGDSGMLGVFQFHERVHAGAASVLGLSLKTLEGNLAYARHLYNNHGTMPWRSTYSCFEHAIQSATSTPSIAPPTRAQLLAKIETLIELIKVLKKLQALQAHST